MDKKIVDMEEKWIVWKKVINYFYHKGELNKESYDHLISFCDAMKRNHLFDEVIEEKEDFVIIEYLENIFEGLNQMYCGKNTFDIKDKQLKELKNQLAVNEEKYIEESYERVRGHYILHEMFGTVGKLLEEHIYMQGKYKNYGKNNDLDFGYHCLSPLEDLLISNVSRGTLYKKIPKDMTGKAEYIYDENGQLILYKKNKEKQGNVSYLQFLLYGKEETVSLLYMVINGMYWLHDVGIQYFKDEQIIKNDIAVWGMGDKVQDLQSINRDSYIYVNKVLVNVWKEQFFFPNFLATRDFYTFRYDEEGYINAFSRREFWGDGERFFPWGEYYVPIQEKKKSDTGKDSPRWKNPNYFNTRGRESKYHG